MDWRRIDILLLRANREQSFVAMRAVVQELVNGWRDEERRYTREIRELETRLMKLEHKEKRDAQDTDDCPDRAGARRLQFWTDVDPAGSGRRPRR